VSNPPYVPYKSKISPQVKYEPKEALYSGQEGNCHIQKIINESTKFLNNISLLALETNETTYKYLKNKKYKFERDLTGKYRYLFIINKSE
jgi:release factor glutamine methyltransferase